MSRDPEEERFARGDSQRYSGWSSAITIAVIVIVLGIVFLVYYLKLPHTADQYQRAAEEAKQLAAKATDSCERVQLLRLAAQWQRLADYKARLESEPPRKSS